MFDLQCNGESRSLLHRRLLDEDFDQAENDLSDDDLGDEVRDSIQQAPAEVDRGLILRDDTNESSARRSWQHRLRGPFRPPVNHIGLTVAARGPFDFPPPPPP